MRYIALLRGINVGRKNRIKMTDLTRVFESMEFKKVRTYLQSGNVIFDHESMDTTNLAVEIERKLSAFGFQVTVLIRREDELESVVESNPFISQTNIELDKLHVTFLLNQPDSKTISGLDLKKDDDEKFKVIGREVYLYCPNGYGRTKLKNDVFEKKLNTTATTRNWKTVNKLLEIVKLGDI